VGQPLNLMPTIVPTVKMQLQEALEKDQPGPFSVKHCKVAFA